MAHSRHSTIVRGLFVAVLAGICLCGPAAAEKPGLPSGNIAIPGQPPSLMRLPAGCAFAPRCRLRAAACEAQRPPLIEVAAGRTTRCLRWRELA